MRETILLTGATGALGRMLVPVLLKDGYEVICLVRAPDRATAQKRIRDLHGRHPALRAIRGDITEPRCGISDHDRDLIRGRAQKKIFHCAASISFGNRLETHNANVNGVMHMLELADVLDAWHIIHVSTAYVAGNTDAFAEESVSSILQRPRNYYEETKQVGETMVRAWALRRDDRRVTILRPSILIGCEDGTSPTFDAYFGYFKPIHRIAESLRKRAQAGKELPEGVTVVNGRVTVPLVLCASETATLNLIPIDWVARTMGKLLAVSPRNEIFHLVNPRPPLVSWVISNSLEILNVDGVQVVETRKAKERLLAAQSKLVRELQRQLDMVLDQYEPYTGHSTVFADANARRALGKAFKEPPMLDHAFLRAQLRFALETNWGVVERRRVEA